MQTRGRTAKQAGRGPSAREAPPVPAGRPDRILAAFTTGLSAILLALTFYSLALYLPSELPTTGGEEAGAFGAWYVRAGQPLYLDWRREEARLLIYGPLYYQLLGQTGRMMRLDRDGLLTLGRTLALLAAAGAALLIALLVRGAGGGALASLAALLPLAWLPLTALKFFVSTRPDALALLLSIGGVAIACRPGAGPPTAAVLLMAAAFTKLTALAAAAAVLVALLLGRQWRAAALYAGLAAALGLGAIGVLHYTTEGGFLIHLLAASEAPRDWRYALDLATNHWQASVLGLLVIVLPVLWMRLRRAPVPTEQGSAVAAGTARIAAVYAPISLALAVLLSGRQGGDVNYLIEPAAATGLLLGAVLAAGQRSPAPAAVRSGRLLMVLLVVVSIAGEPLTRLRAAQQEAAQARALGPVYRGVAEWIGRQPRPLLSLEPWLAYRAGVDGFISDRIAYTSAALRHPEWDVAAQRTEERHFAAIVLYEPVERAGRAIYQDIPYATPRLCEAIRGYYLEGGSLYGWYVYFPRAADPP
jgi:hypothetical protein